MRNFEIKNKKKIVKIYFTLSGAIRCYPVFLFFVFSIYHFKKAMIVIKCYYIFVQNYAHIWLALIVISG
ncbi:unnamed protein product [Brugia timori]|uniref:Uncharacterized protein n=1 Tax=Brugia timori TaxID=42155 RepID=A0A3P7WJN3_9BILA|nr:unnamed protein product [Brugia timori]